MRTRVLLLPFALSILLAATVTPAPATAQTWLINEVATGSPDYLELVNCSSQPLDPSGLCLWYYEVRGNQDPCNAGTPSTFYGLHLTLCVPAGTPPVPPGGLFVIEENGAVGTPPPTCVAGTGTGANIPWNADSDLIIWINQSNLIPTQGILDMVSFGHINQYHHAMRTFVPNGEWLRGPVTRPNAGYNSVYRPALAGQSCPSDTNTALDWRFAAINEGTKCRPNLPLRPNPLTFGEGYSASGNCSSSSFSTATELPTLTIDGVAPFDPTPGGSYDLKIYTGMTAAPPITCLLFGPSQVQGTPTLLPACLGRIVDYVDPFASGSLCVPALNWDSQFAATILSVPIPGRASLVGARLTFQGYMFDLAAGSCFLRNTNAIKIEVVAPPRVLIEAVGSDSFNSVTTSGFWKISNLGTSAISQVVFDWTASSSPLHSNTRFDTDQTGMADRFDGGQAGGTGCQNTYRNGSASGTGLIFSGTTSSTCATGTGWIGSNPMSGTPTSYRTLQFDFVPGFFGTGEVFEFDADTDGSGVTGADMEGLVVTVTLLNGTVLTGELRVDQTMANRSFAIF